MGSIYKLSLNFNCVCICLERLMDGIEEIKKALAYKYGHLSENTEDANAQIEDHVVSATSKSNPPFYFHVFCKYT